MRFRQLIPSIAILVLATLALYLLIARHLMPPQVEAPPPPKVSQLPAQASVSTAPRSNGADRDADSRGSAAMQPPAGGRKLLEIFGRVLDREGRPIANALITEERYFFTARSDTDGRYRILLDLPRHRYPSLHYLRSGYTGKLVRLRESDLRQAPVHELDVILDEANDTVGLQGWVGNEIGEGLDGARVELISAPRAGRDGYYLTVFSDASGRFEFEGVRADENYTLTVNLPPEYPYYEDADFHVSRNPARIEVTLEKLRFVDIDGMILGDDGQPVPNYEMYISNLTSGSHSRKIVSDSSGFFSLAHFPVGEVSLSTRGPEFFKISGLQITETRFQNLAIRVDRGNHYLSGWVSDAHGVAVEKAMVTLDRSHREDGVEYISYRSQATDRNGAFEFQALGAGEYRITVYALGYRKHDRVFRATGPASKLHIALQRY